MVEEYGRVRTKVGKKYSDVFVKDVYIPIGVEAYVVDKSQDGYCIKEFVDYDAGYPIVADYLEDELEMIKDDE